MTLVRPIAVEARPGHRIWLRYEDGAEGEVDLSEHVGLGVFKAWEDPAFFEAVWIEPYDAIAWADEIELCPNALYMELTGKTVEELMPAVRGMSVDA